MVRWVCLVPNYGKAMCHIVTVFSLTLTMLNVIWYNCILINIGYTAVDCEANGVIVCCLFCLIHQGKGDGELKGLGQNGASELTSVKYGLLNAVNEPPVRNT